MGYCDAVISAMWSLDRTSFRFESEICLTKLSKCWILCQIPCVWGLVRVLVFNATFNNISVISWLSVLFVEETGVPRVNNWPVASHWQTLSHKCFIEYTLPERHSNSQLQWWQVLIAHVIVNPTAIRSWWPLSLLIDCINKYT